MDQRSVTSKDSGVNLFLGNPGGICHNVTVFFSEQLMAKLVFWSLLCQLLLLRDYSSHQDCLCPDHSGFLILFHLEGKNRRPVWNSADPTGYTRKWQVWSFNFFSLSTRAPPHFSLILFILINFSFSAGFCFSSLLCPYLGLEDTSLWFKVILPLP